MLEIDEKRVYPLADKNGNIQGTMNVAKSLIDGNKRVEIRIVGQISSSNEEVMAEEINKFVKSFYL